MSVIMALEGSIIFNAVIMLFFVTSAEEHVWQPFFPKSDCKNLI